MPDLSVFENIIKLTHDHFDSEVVRYMGRLFEIHLHKPADQLTKEELVSLMDWVYESLTYLVEDHRKIENYMRELHDYAAGTASML